MVGLIKMRKTNNLKQKDLASMIGVKTNTISQYELGKRNPNPDILKKIARVLNCTIDDLLKEETENKN